MGQSGVGGPHLPPLTQASLCCFCFFHLILLPVHLSFCILCFDWLLRPQSGDNEAQVCLRTEPLRHHSAATAEDVNHNKQWIMVEAKGDDDLIGQHIRTHHNMDGGETQVQNIVNKKLFFLLKSHLSLPAVFCFHQLNESPGGARTEHHLVAAVPPTSLTPWIIVVITEWTPPPL